MGDRSLYATLIGINAYKQGPLSGCIKDVLAIDLLLREICSQQGEQKLTYNPKYFLAPNDADKALLTSYTKEHKLKNFTNTLPTFRDLTTTAFEHLKQAKDGDICLFYYSGHGSQTEAPPEFWHIKPNRQNETLVCLDSRDASKAEARDLVDKELGYLFWNAFDKKDVHAVIIMDCCHSGNNTRGLADDIRSRYLFPSRTKIPFDNYIGYDSGFYEVANGKASILTARYVHLAAAMDTEKAQESSDGGLFSTKLIQVLRSGGTAKSYRELMKTINTMVKTRNPQQNPVPFALHDEDLDQQFLGKGLVSYQPSFEVRYYSDRNNPQWRMYGGAQHGIVASSTTAKTTVSIGDESDEIEVKEVFATYSILDEAGMQKFDKGIETYKAYLKQLSKKPILVKISDEVLQDEGSMSDIKQAFKSNQFTYFTIDFENSSGSADYIIRLLPGSGTKNYSLTLPGSEIPVFKRETDIVTFLNNIEKVGKWTSVANISNTNSKFNSNHFTFEIEKLEGVPVEESNDKSNWELLPLKPDDEIVCSYVNGHPPLIRFKTAIAAAANFNSVFAGALYMDCRFGISYNLVRPDESELRKIEGSVLNLKTVEEDGTIYDSIILEFDEKFSSHGLFEIIDSIKLFIASKPLDLDNFKQDALEVDEKPADRGVTRGMGSRIKKTGTTTEEDWTVFTFRLRIAGPGKKQKLQAGKQTQMASIAISVPEGFQATAFTATSDDLKAKKRVSGTRDLEDPVTGIPLAEIWGETMTADFTSNEMAAIMSSNDIEAIEFLPANDGDDLVLNYGQEIIITTPTAKKTATPSPVTRSARTTRSGPASIPGEQPTPVQQEQTIVPYGFDPGSGLFFPVGYTDDSGQVHIQTLPPMTNGRLEDQQPATRSLGGSVKLFFKKLLRKKKLDTLVLYRHDKNEGWEKVADDPAKMKSFLEIKPGGKAILLIHGITGDTKYMLESLKEITGLAEHVDFILTYDYENLSSPIAAIATRLQDDLANAGFTEDNMPGLIIVAHSMGGLVSRWLIEKNQPEKKIPVKHLLLVGTPSGGSELANLGKSVFSMLTHALNVTGPVKYAIAGLSFLLKKLEIDPLNTLRELRPDSDTIRQLSQSSNGRKTSYTIIGGDTSLLKKGYSGDDFFLKKLSQALVNKLVYPGLTNTVFKDESNDMAVTLKSMRAIPGLEEVNRSLIVPTNHSGYFGDNECRKQIINCLDEVGQ